MRKVRAVWCPHCGGRIQPLPEPQRADASDSAAVIEGLATVDNDISNESSDEKTANDFAAALRRNTPRGQLPPARRNRS